MQRRYIHLAIIIIAASAVVTFSAGTIVAADNERLRKEIRAARVTDGNIELDGHLDESAWQDAPAISDFTQKLPAEGEPPTYPVEVRVLYDEHALYVGGRMYCGDTDNLRLHLEQRDSQGPAEQLIVVIDSYLNRRTAYAFGINTAGVRFDRFHPSDDEGDRDFSYNPVWTGKTALGEDYWTAEMRIPFSQLRFNNQEEQRWGINFNHWIPQRNEDVFWVMVPRDEVGYASRFGDLVGIEDIKPSRRLELLP